MTLHNSLRSVPQTSKRERNLGGECNNRTALDRKAANREEKRQAREARIAALSENYGDRARAIVDAQGAEAYRKLLADVEAHHAAKKAAVQRSTTSYGRGYGYGW